MFQVLDRQAKLTGNQKRIVLAAILGDMLDFFDGALIIFVLAFIVGPWKLTYGQSAVVLLSSGLGAIPGSAVWGWLADRIGRRTVFIATVLNFSIASGILAFTPDGAWIFLSIFRFLVGFGGAGLYSVDLPLVQEYMPVAKRGAIGGLITACIPIGTALGAVLGAYATPFIGWRGLFIVGLLPAAFTLLIRAWVPESPRWLIRRGRVEDARKSLAWALEIDPSQVPVPATITEPARRPWHHIFKYPRSLIVSWISILGQQTIGYGASLWSATLFVMLLGVSPAEASYLMIWIAIGGFTGRLVWSALSELIGRVPCGIIIGAGGAIATAAAGYAGQARLSTVSVFFLLMLAARFFSEGGFAVTGPYAAEIWPSDLRASGMGSAYGFGSLGKVIGPLGLALIVGSSNIVNPQASLAMLGPAFLYLAAWGVLSGAVYLFAIETKGRSIEDIEARLATPGASPIGSGVRLRP